MANKMTVFKIKNKKTRETIQGYLFLLPSFIILGVFVFWPIGYSFVLSFFKWDFANQKNPYFNGLENYAKLFRMDMELPYSFWEALAYSAAYIMTALAVVSLVKGFTLSQKHFGDRSFDPFRKRKFVF